jgi:hypothetical protein
MANCAVFKLRIYRYAKICWYGPYYKKNKKRVSTFSIRSYEQESRYERLMLLVTWGGGPNGEL